MLFFFGLLETSARVMHTCIVSPLIINERLVLLLLSTDEKKQKCFLFKNNFKNPLNCTIIIFNIKRINTGIPGVLLRCRNVH